MKAALERRKRKQKLSGENQEINSRSWNPKKRVVEMESVTKSQMRKDIEKVKFTVQQYGLKAYTPEERRKFERQRLIKLGAKAPKAEWKNYKGICFYNFICKMINNLALYQLKITWKYQTS